MRAFVLRLLGDKPRQREKGGWGDKHTWRGSDAEATREVILQGAEDGHHVGLDFLQTDDVFHQSGIKIHLRRLALGLGLGRHEEEK